MYIGFLMSEPKSATCTHLSEVMGISHDSVNRFLSREDYDPKDLFDESIRELDPIGGTLNVDDSTLDKPYSQRMDLVSHFWSGKHHRVVKGLNLITLYYTDRQGCSLPVNYRLYDKSDGKTKNDYFLIMLADVLEWGIKPAFMTGDSWYSGINNLKTVRNYQMGFLFAIKNNRSVSIEKGTWAQVKSLDISEKGQQVWLKDFGEVRLFRTRLKDELRHYILFLPEENYDTFSQSDFRTLHDQHWEIEQYHRMIKQVCNIERFQVRGEKLIRNHVFAALCGYVHLQKMQFEGMITNAYQWHRNLFNEVIAQFTQQFIIGKDHMNPQFQSAVNA